MEHKKKLIGFRTIKTVIGAALAVYISQRLNLAYAVNSGIIVILSVQATRKKSRDLAIMRIGSTILALGIGTIVFTLIGYSAISFGVYLLFFIPIATRLKFNDGIVPCSVLVSHLVAVESVALPSLLNEMMQMLIGAGIGFILNLYMPSLDKQIKKDIVEIEAMFKQILKNMATSLRNQQPLVDHTLYHDLEQKLKICNNRAWMESENKMTKEVTEHVKYIEARLAQFEMLHHMKRYFKRIRGHYDQTMMVAELTDMISNRFDKTSTLEEIIDTFKAYRLRFKEMKLPQTREEFENRSLLYEYVNDLEHFLEAKGAIMHTLE
ncbi:MAG TPA: hypothetical protein DCS67_06260 [Clostridiales bacterium UBA8960]|jgi:uncharacterized membrane protein YgaE (UPF0421/DUF939 family)|nr:hypothetical protein [Clostridiales bacterium UBA8960]